MKPAHSNASVIARNSFWYGLETAIDIAVNLATSIAIARSFGPAQLGYFIYFVFIITIVERLGAFGIPAAACKYMAEYLGRGEPGLCRAVFWRTLRLQSLVAAGFSALAVAAVIAAAEPGYRLMAVLLAVSIFPSMFNSIPSQANVAREAFSKNVPGALVYVGVFVCFNTAVLIWHWGVAGLAAALLAARAAEAAVRFVPVCRWARSLPVERLPEEASRKLFLFSRQNVVILLLSIVVWDRSELIFLKAFSSIEQVAFYSLAFNVIQKLLTVPRVFAGAVGATLFVQYGRDKESIRSMMTAATRYAGLLSLPLFLGMAAIAPPAVALTYGPKYLPVIPVLQWMAILAIPRGFQYHTELLFQATDNQRILLRWMFVMAAVNIALDAKLIPAHGAIGAALANGAAQSTAVLGLWVLAARVLNAPLPWRFLGRVALSAAVMFVCVYAVCAVFSPVWAVGGGIVLGAAVYLGMLRIAGCLETQDKERLLQLRAKLPGRVRPGFDWSLGQLLPPVPPRAPMAELVQTLEKPCPAP